MLPANAERLSALEPIGRAVNGGLMLRAPPEFGDLSRFVGTVRGALAAVGDKAAAAAVIVSA